MWRGRGRGKRSAVDERERDYLLYVRPNQLHEPKSIQRACLRELGQGQPGKLIGVLLHERQQSGSRATKRSAETGRPPPVVHEDPFLH